MFLPEEQQQAYEKFIQDYRHIRIAEGRGSPDPAYYRQLPFRDLTGKFAADWKIRAKSFQKLLQDSVIPMERSRPGRLKILDLGAGNGWLSYHLARRGHALAAIDLQLDPFDGLGAHIHYDQPFLAVQADFNRLPFGNSQADAVIFNASFHYSTGYETSLREALRVLHPEGRIVILDTPVYQDASSGAQMVRERETRFQESYGFPSNAIESENFLTYQRLSQLGEEIGLTWDLYPVNYGLSWSLRPFRARLAGRREPAQFHLIAGSRRKPF